MLFNVYYLNFSKVYEIKMMLSNRTADNTFWKNLARESQQEFQRSGTTGKCIEARELIICHRTGSGSDGGVWRCTGRQGEIMRQEQPHGGKPADDA